MVSLAQHSVLGIIPSQGGWDVSTDEQILVLLGQVGLGHGTPLSLIFPVDALLKPVGNEGS